MRLLVEAVRDGVLPATPDSEVVDQMLVHVRLLEALLKVQRDGRERRHGAALAQTVQISALLEEWTQAMRLKAHHGQIDLRLSVADDLPRVQCRADEISRVLLNLIGNAIRHTPAGGVVQVRAIAHPGGVQIQVNDGGPGLTRRARAILDGAASTAPDGRVGLGLAIARKIVKAHGGALWASTPPRGASLRFYLPAVAAEVVAEASGRPDVGMRAELTA